MAKFPEKQFAYLDGDGDGDATYLYDEKFAIDCAMDQSRPDDDGQVYIAEYTISALYRVSVKTVYEKTKVG